MWVSATLRSVNTQGGFGAVMMVTASFGMAAVAKTVDKLVAGARRPAERATRTS